MKTRTAMLLSGILCFLILFSPRPINASLGAPKTYNIDIGSTIDDNCVLYLNFDENTGATENRVYDSSGDNNHGTLYNGPTWVDGKVGSALSFDGVDDYVRITKSPSLGLDQLTISAWVKLGKLDTLQQIIVNIHYVDEEGFALQFIYNKFALVLYGSGWYSIFYSNTTYTDTTKWYHVVATYDKQNMRIFVNGVADGSKTETRTIQYVNESTYIGRCSYTSAWGFNGTIDEVRVYNRALTAEEIMEHYKKNLLKLTDTTPRISWSYYDEDGDNCKSVQIQVGTFPSGNDMWDYQENSSVTYIDYAGAPLVRGTTYYLRVRTDDGYAWSEWGDNLAFRLNQLPTAENQKAEGQVNPEDVSTLAPALSWDYVDLDGDTQSKRQIQVGTSENDNSMWDSTVSTSSTSATYAGASLSGGVTYHWRVRVYDGYEWSGWLYGGTFRLSQLPTTNTDSHHNTYPDTNPNYDSHHHDPNRGVPWAWVGVGIAIGVAIGVIGVVLIWKGKKLLKPKSIERMIPFILIIICVAAARFISSEVLVLAVFIVTLGIYAWRKYDSRMLVGTAIFLLVVCAGLLAFGSESLANNVATWAYYFLVVGVLGLFIGYLRERREE